MLQLRSVFDYELVEDKKGFVSVIFYGKGSKKLFENEGGGHRWQRVSPTEKRGRTHTSTITVAVLDPLDTNFLFNMNDVDIYTTRGSGPGGQHRNKTDSCVVATHSPTGISVRVDMKSQKQSKDTALAILNERIKNKKENEQLQKHNNIRKQQIGSGMRGDKIRTYRTKDDSVVDHRTGKKVSLKKWMKGKW